MNQMKKIAFPAILLQVSLFFFISNSAFAQETPQEDYNAEEIEQYKEDAKRLVSFFQFTLNTIGDPESIASEKETIIQESYRKFFRDDKVQIEDDLDTKRVVPTNKDVQAYLKDVDFFYKNITFEFNIEDVTHFTNENNELAFKVSLSRNLQGTTIDNQEVNNSQQRFIEINLNEANKDLKIVSVYTTRLSLDEELSNWWNELSADWRGEFSKLVNNPALTEGLLMNQVASIEDSVVTDNAGTSYPLSEIMIEHLKEVTNIESVDISRHPAINDLTPLNKLTNLKELNFSNTQVSNLQPIRNLTKLKIINFSSTGVGSLEELKYAISLEQIYCNNSSALSDLSPVSNFKNLQILHCHNNSSLTDISPVAALENLTELNCDNTAISDVSALKDLKSLKTLKVSNTRISNLSDLNALTSLERLELKGNKQISDISALYSLNSLRLLFIDNTSVSDLSPLQQLSNITTIYCDGAKVTKNTAKAFMQAHPKCLVIYETGALEDWWASLDNGWKSVFRSIGSFSNPPDKEKLHEISNIKSIDISNNGNINTVEPLSVLFNLEELNCENTRVSNIAALQDLTNLQTLNVSKTNVTDLSPIQGLKALKSINFNETEVASITPLKDLNQLKKIYANNSRVYDLLLLRGIKSLEVAYFDNTPVNDSKVNLLYEHNPSCLIIYKTEGLQGWWRRLSSPWKNAFQKQGVQIDDNPTTEQLHQISKIEEVNITGESSITKLDDIQTLKRLKRLRMGNTGVTDIEVLEKLTKLELLHMPKNFVRNLWAIAKLKRLTSLDIEDVPVDNLDFLAGLRKVVTLNCSGTEIKDLKPLENVRSLKYLSCFGTDIKTLKWVDGIGLETLKCYNTKLSAGKVSKFRESNKKCEVIF